MPSPPAPVDPKATRRRRARLRTLAATVAGLIAIAIVIALYARRPLPIPDAATGDEHLPSLFELEAWCAAPEAELPTALHSLEVAHHQFPGWMVGEPESEHVIQTMALIEIVTPTGTIAIDPPHPKDLDDRFPFVAPGDYDDAAYAKTVERLRGAEIVLITHEHFDHASTISRASVFDIIAGRFVLSERQRRSPLMTSESGFTNEQLPRVRVVAGAGAVRLRAGVALIPTPGHTPGSQVVVARLRGAAALVVIAGDVAWRSSNVSKPQGHPRLLHWMQHEDGAAMAAQLRWLHDLEATKRVRVIVSHDREQRARLEREGVFAQVE